MLFVVRERESTLRGRLIRISRFARLIDPVASKTQTESDERDREREKKCERREMDKTRTCPGFIRNGWISISILVVVGFLRVSFVVCVLLLVEE